MFQSLFSWNSPSDTGSQGRMDPMGAVSILVFVELALGRGLQYLDEFGNVMFQSLFSWNSPSDRITDPTKRAMNEFQSLFSWNSPSDNNMQENWRSYMECFNPCFRGTRPRTQNNLVIIWQFKMFQSLFSWNSPSDIPRVPQLSRSSKFQSLFSWNSPSDSSRL